MSASTFPLRDKPDVAATTALGRSGTVIGLIDAFLSVLASLKITVALLALGIFVVLVGTLAQVESDIWQVVPLYFRSWIMWVDINLFFPPSFFPNWKPVAPRSCRFPAGWRSAWRC